MSHSLSRRTILTAAVATATTAATKIPAQAASPAFSAEYLACYTVWIDCERMKEINYRADVTETEAILERYAIDRWQVAKAALLARPVEGLMDVLERLRVSVWESGHFVRLQRWPGDEVELMRAVEALVGASPWLVPEELRALDEQHRAEEEARHAILRMDYFDVGADV